MIALDTHLSDEARRAGDKNTPARIEGGYLRALVRVKSTSVALDVFVHLIESF